MVQYTQTRFGASFAGLSDATRRGALEQLELDKVVEELKRKEKVDGRKKRE